MYSSLSIKIYKISIFVSRETKRHSRPFSRACKLSLNRVQAWLNMPTTSGSKTGKTSPKKELKPTSASREMLIQKLAAEMAVLKATNDALENQNNEILGICSKS